MSDTICALATASGRAALAVVRLSGVEAFSVARRLLGWSSDREIVPRRATLATLVDERGEPIDQAVVTFFPAPASYTGEDVVEFSGHGGLVAPARVLAALFAGGARQALPGEFTRRAVLNGRMDLIQAEGVGDLIEATSRAQGRAALHQLEGGLSRRLGDLRARFVDLLAMLAYDIDFPEEDDGPIDRAEILDRVREARRGVQSVLATAPVGTRVQRGALVVLAGRPNAGKSSLFNALLGMERAIVTELPGTTRDAVEAAAEVDGWPLRLVDTAGLRGSDDRVERLGIEMSRRYLDAADLILLCLDIREAPNEDEARLATLANVVVVRTKADLVETAARNGLAVSVVDGQGLATLRLELVNRLFRIEGVGDAEPLLTSERQRQGLERAEVDLAAAEGEFGGQGDTLLAAHHVQAAVMHLDEVVGVVDFEEVLGRLFGRFCVGK